jgi:hypothetical protein
MTLFSLNNEIVKNKESSITLNWMSLNDERGIKYSFLDFKYKFSPCCKCSKLSYPKENLLEYSLFLDW